MSEKESYGGPENLERRSNPFEGALASLYAMFDILCGVSALPGILFSSLPPQKNYLSAQEECMNMSQQRNS